MTSQPVDSPDALTENGDVATIFEGDQQSTQAAEALEELGNDPENNQHLVRSEDPQCDGGDPDAPRLKRRGSCDFGTGIGDENDKSRGNDAGGGSSGANEAVAHVPQQQQDASTAASSEISRTDPIQKRRLSEPICRRSSWLGIPGMGGAVRRRSSVATAGDDTEDYDEAAAHVALSDFDRLLLEDMAESEGAVAVPEVDHTDGKGCGMVVGPLVDVTESSRMMAAGVDAASVAAKGKIGCDASSFVTAKPFLHPLQHSHGAVDTDKEGDVSKAASLSVIDRDDVPQRRLSWSKGASVFGFRQSDTSTGSSASVATSSSRPPSLLLLNTLSSIRLANGIDDDNSVSGASISTIGSSVHTGAIVRGLGTRTFSSKVAQKLSPLLNSAPTSRRLALLQDELYHDEDEQDWLLEEEIFAAEDEANAALLGEAHELMKKVNLSTGELGVEPPFRPTNEIFPQLGLIHHNLRRHLGNQQVIGLAEPNGDSTDQKKQHQCESVVERPMESSDAYSIEDDDRGTKLASTPDEAVPPLDDHKAVAEYLTKRMLSQMIAQEQKKSQKQSGAKSTGTKRRDRRPQLSRSISEDFQHFTAFIPNYMWYQPIPADASSRIRPTSLCSGTGVTSGLKYIDPEMMGVFNLFGSYFVGALAENDINKDREDGKSDENPSSRRSARWLDTIDEGDSVVSGEADPSVDETNASVDSTVVQPVLSEMQMVMLQAAIKDLLRNQKQESGKEASSCGSSSSSSAAVAAAGISEEVQVENDRDRDRGNDHVISAETTQSDKIAGNIVDKELSSEHDSFVSAENAREEDGFYVGFPQSSHEDIVNPDLNPVLTESGEGSQSSNDEKKIPTVDISSILPGTDQPRGTDMLFSGGIYQGHYFESNN